MEAQKKGFFRSLFTPVNVVEASVPQVRDTPTPPLGSSVIAPANYADSVAQTVSVKEALSLPAVQRAADIISGDVAQLSIGVWRKVDGVRIEVEPQPLIRQPDPNISRAEFLEQTTLSMVLHGNAFWRVYRQDDSDPISRVLRLEVLNPDLVFIETDDLGRTTGYHFNGKDLKLHQVEHINKFPVWWSAYGQGPIQSNQRFLRGAIELEKYAAFWFNTGQVPNGVLSTDQVLTPPLADEIRQRWIELQRAHGRGVAVLGNGMSYQPIYLNPEQAQFLQSQEFAKTQIATMFGVQAYLLNAAVEGSNLTYQNIQDANRDYINHTLMKYLNKIESALTRLTPRGQEIRFKTEDLLRADYKTQVETIKSAKEAGLMSTNEGRERLELPPTTEGGQPGETPGSTTLNGIS